MDKTPNSCPSKKTNPKKRHFKKKRQKREREREREKREERDERRHRRRKTKKRKNKRNYSLRPDSTFLNTQPERERDRERQRDDDDAVLRGCGFLLLFSCRFVLLLVSSSSRWWSR